MVLDVVLCQGLMVSLPFERLIFILRPDLKQRSSARQGHKPFLPAPCQVAGSMEPRCILCDGPGVVAYGQRDSTWSIYARSLHRCRPSAVHDITYTDTDLHHYLEDTQMRSLEITLKVCDKHHYIQRLLGRSNRLGGHILLGLYNGKTKETRKCQD